MKDKKLPPPTKKIVFADGQVVALNRKERRRLKLYNHKLKPYQGEQQ